MKYWEWQIPRIFAEYVAVLEREGHPIYQELVKLQYSETGAVPYVFEVHKDVFLMRIHRHRVIYERMAETRQLIFASIERTT